MTDKFKKIIGMCFEANISFKTYYDHGCWKIYIEKKNAEIILVDEFDGDGAYIIIHDIQFFKRFSLDATEQEIFSELNFLNNSLK